ncbi:AmmeMemoRadiSam system radical SAM enzyme, partial [Thermodesulfobacteriota bacterium]
MAALKKVKCELCPTECVLAEYQVGSCRVRINKDGELYSLVYGKPCAVHIDPIEKKPFSHLLPSTSAFSIATVGCTLSCKFCQNWQISQANPEEGRFHDLPPERVVAEAIRTGCQSIAYTYTEPTVFYEYMYDTAEIAHEKGLLNTYITCGYINKAPLLELCKVMDGANVDLKGFTEDYYRKICGGKLKPVLDSLVIMKENDVWVEVTNLIVPTLNDDLKLIRSMCKWLYENLGADTPLHFSRFHPDYKLKNLPSTPVKTLVAARNIAMEEGIRYVYIGNVAHDGNNTFCYSCKKELIRRRGFFVSMNNLENGKCKFCKVDIAGR